MLIEDLIGVQQGKENYILFALLAHNEDKSLQIRIDAIGDNRWRQYTEFAVGEIYNFKRHFNSNEPPFDKRSDPMELWEYLRPGQKENETILPQILLYFWHNDEKLDMELDW